MSSKSSNTGPLYHHPYLPNEKHNSYWQVNSINDYLYIWVVQWYIYNIYNIYTYEYTFVEETEEELVKKYIQNIKVNRKY